MIASIAEEFLDNCQLVARELLIILRFRRNMFAFFNAARHELAKQNTIRQNAFRHFANS